MKTLKNTIKAVILLTTALFITSCDNKKDSNNNASGYYYVNGYCLAQGTNQQVDPAKCNGVYNNGYNTGYQYVNGVCIQTSTGQQVNPQLCTTNNGGGYGQQCVGSYWFWNGYGYQQVQCAGSNCRGYQLVPVGSQQTVTCY